MCSFYLQPKINLHLELNTQLTSSLNKASAINLRERNGEVLHL